LYFIDFLLSSLLSLSLSLSRARLLAYLFAYFSYKIDKNYKYIYYLLAKSEGSIRGKTPTTMAAATTATTATVAKTTSLGHHGTRSAMATTALGSHGTSCAMATTPQESHASCAMAMTPPADTRETRMMMPTSSNYVCTRKAETAETGKIVNDKKVSKIIFYMKKYY